MMVSQIQKTKLHVEAHEVLDGSVPYFVKRIANG